MADFDLFGISALPGPFNMDVGPPEFDLYYVPLVSQPASTIQPVVSNLTPPNGTAVYPDTPLSFRITDETGEFALIIPFIILDPFRVPEPVHNGALDEASAAFNGLYSLSNRVAVAGPPAGFDFTIRRNGGWTSTPRLLIWAVDIDGNVWIGP